MPAFDIKPVTESLHELCMDLPWRCTAGEAADSQYNIWLLKQNKQEVSCSVLMGSGRCTGRGTSSQMTTQWICLLLYLDLRKNLGSSRSLIKEQVSLSPDLHEG